MIRIYVFMIGALLSSAPADANFGIFRETCERLSVTNESSVCRSRETLAEEVTKKVFATDVLDYVASLLLVADPGANSDDPLGPTVRDLPETWRSVVS